MLGSCSFWRWYLLLYSGRESLIYILFGILINGFHGGHFLRNKNWVAAVLCIEDILASSQQPSPSLLFLLLKPCSLSSNSWLGFLLSYRNMLLYLIFYQMFLHMLYKTPLGTMNVWPNPKINESCHLLIESTDLTAQSRAVSAPRR